MDAVSVLSTCLAVLFCALPEGVADGSIVPTQAATFEEVEILLDGTIGLEEIQALPQAPAGQVVEMSDPARVVVQLPAHVVTALRKRGVHADTLRTFLLFEPGERAPAIAAPKSTMACGGNLRAGESGTDVAIPDYAGWVYSVIYLTGAPANAVVSCIDVHCEIVHSWIGDLDVDLNDANLTYNYDLWGPGQGSGEYLTQTVTGITTFNGEAVNQPWVLYAQDVLMDYDGYIDYWWIKVYYGGTTSQPDLVMDTSSRSPATGVTPDSAVNLAHTVANRGTAAASATFWATWFISTDASVTTSDYEWAYQELAGLDAGATSSAGGAIAWPNVAPYNVPGQKYYVAVMADDTNEISESSEDNNWGQVWEVTLAGTPCCSPQLSAGNRVKVLVNNPGGAANLLTGHCGTVLCCDSGDPQRPIMVSWDNWSNGENTDASCDVPPAEYPANSGWWMSCGEIALDAGCGPCAPPPPPSDPVPADGATDVRPEVELCWNTPPAVAKVIYGADDRKDVYQVSDPGLLSAADSTVALVAKSILTNNGNGTYSLPPTPTFAQDTQSNYGYPLCSAEPFGSQPVPAFCSGSLVGPDLVVTAGHCITNASECAATAFVFGFDMLSASSPVLTFPQADVYFCNSIVGRVQNSNGADWGVIRLDRPVTGRPPLPVRCSGKVANAQALVMIGHPMGLPTKIAGGAVVRDNNPATYFKANLDAYAGNSGSAVLNANGLQVEGLLVRGNPDFKLSGGCVTSNVCPDTGCSGTTSLWEDVTRATEFAQLVPACTQTQYDVHFGPCGSMSLVHAGPETCWGPTALQADTEYCWQVTVRSSCGTSPGPVWSFTTGHCIEAADPPNCAIDSRQPHQPNGSNPAGWDSVALTFGAGCNTAAITAGSFTVSEVPAGSPISVSSVQKVGSVVTVRLSRRISTGVWTCVSYGPTGEEACLGFLPADVNNDRGSNLTTATAADVLAVIDNLNGSVQPPYATWQCDVDRSGVCGPADILRVIDLLNGADRYDPWLGRTLPVCPSFR